VVKIPAEALASPQNFQINAQGQMLFAPTVALPLTEGDFCRREEDLVLERPHGYYPSARHLKNHRRSRVKLGDHRVGACAISFGGWSASILVLEIRRAACSAMGLISPTD